MKVFTTHASSDSNLTKDQGIGVFDSYLFLSNSAKESNILWEKSLEEKGGRNTSVLDQVFLLGIIQKEDIPYFSENTSFREFLFTGKESEDHISFSIELRTD